MGESTISISLERPRDQRGPCAWLMFALQCDQPFAPAARCSLGGAHEVLLGRNLGARTRSLGERNGALRVLLPDGRISSDHCRLTQLLGQWVLEDLKSKNGTLVNGVRTQQAPLKHGDVIELGRTFAVFWEEPAPEEQPERPPERLVELGPSEGELSLVTLLPSLRAELEHLWQVSKSPIPILLEGESGAGKEVAAREIHRRSGRSGAFQAVNCAAIAKNLLEAELFGSRRGAFTGSVDNRPGLIRAADHGTLFLDEIGDLALESQAALLRVLQESEILPVGATRPEPVDLRVVAATHQDVRAMVQAGSFRQDLLARLSGHRFQIPALSARKPDLGLLLGAIAWRKGLDPALQLGVEAARALLSHPWPGNVRELEHALQLAAATAGGKMIDLEHLRLDPGALAPPPPGRITPPPPVATGSGSEGERQALVALLEANGGNVAAVARLRSTSRTQIHREAQRLGIDLSALRDKLSGEG